jgi:hypothetical protein
MQKWFTLAEDCIIAVDATLNTYMTANGKNYGKNDNVADIEKENKSWGWIEEVRKQLLIGC